jgi:hypothetical protein
MCAIWVNFAKSERLWELTPTQISGHKSWIAGIKLLISTYSGKVMAMLGLEQLCWGYEIPHSVHAS